MPARINNLLIRPFLVGFSVLLIMIILLTPFVILVRNVSLDVKSASCLVLFLCALSVLIGHISLNRRLPFMSVSARLFLDFYSSFYKEFLVQASRYFCDQNKTAPFTKVIKVVVTNGVEILAFQTNELEDGVVVFVPGSQELTSGFVAIVSKDRVQETGISPEELVKFALTCGASVVR